MYMYIPVLNYLRFNLETEEPRVVRQRHRTKVSLPARRDTWHVSVLTLPLWLCFHARPIITFLSCIYAVCVRGGRRGCGREGRGREAAASLRRRRRARARRPPFVPSFFCSRRLRLRRSMHPQFRTLRRVRKGLAGRGRERKRKEGRKSKAGERESVTNKSGTRGRER